MQPPDELQRELVQQWLDKANEDFDTAIQLARRVRDQVLNLLSPYLCKP